MKLTANQKKIVERIENGELNSAETGNVTGNSVAILIRKGAVSCRHCAYNHPETTYHGRRIKGSMWFGGLFVN